MSELVGQQLDDFAAKLRNIIVGDTPWEDLSADSRMRWRDNASKVLNLFRDMNIATVKTEVKSAVISYREGDTIKITSYATVKKSPITGSLYVTDDNDVVWSIEKLAARNGVELIKRGDPVFEAGKYYADEKNEVWFCKYAGPGMKATFMRTSTFSAAYREEIFGSLCEVKFVVAD